MPKCATRYVLAAFCLAWAGCTGAKPAKSAKASTPSSGGKSAVRASADASMTTSAGASGAFVSPPPTPGGTASPAGNPAIQCGGQSTGSESVSLQTARERGYDPDAMLSGIEGVFEADVRWDQPFADPQTRAHVEIASDGTGNIMAWDCKSGANGTPSCRTGNFLVLNIRVTLVTSDGRLDESFVGTLGPDWGTMSRSEYAHGTRIFASAGLSAVHRPLPIDLELNQTADVITDIMTASGKSPRIEIRVPVVEGNTTVREVAALRLDGCDVVTDFYAPGESVAAFVSPNGFCVPGRFAEGSCCAHWPERRMPLYPNPTWSDSSCIPRADTGADAGADVDAGPM